MSVFSTFTSESVSLGHPDKVCDQISDAILDAALRQQSNAKVACESLIKDNTLVIGGEVNGTLDLDYGAIGLNVLRNVYGKESVDGHWGFDVENAEVIDRVGSQSEEINTAVTETDFGGAGDQGMMFGYASDESEGVEGLVGRFMPAPIALAHELMRQHSVCLTRQAGLFGPDAKCQLTMRYADNGVVDGIDAIVFSTMHSEDISQDEIDQAVYEEILDVALPAEWWKNRKLALHINPSSRQGGGWILGGPAADCGLTGRKIIVDTYGGAAHHGGGAFSGKDPTKVDRSAAYAARYAAKNIVAAGLAKRCEIQVSYAIGVAEPVAIAVNTFGTAIDCSDSEIELLVREKFEWRPNKIIESLQLDQPIYQKTATFGHFGRGIEDQADNHFTWERTDKIDALRS